MIDKSDTDELDYEYDEYWDVEGELVDLGNGMMLSEYFLGVDCE